MAGQFSRFNAIDQMLDVAGSPRQEPDRLLTDETGGFGYGQRLNTGATATITAFGAGLLTVGGLTGMVAGSVGTLLSLRGAGLAGNNGMFRITAYTSPSIVVVADANGYFPDPASGLLSWDNYNAGVAASITTVVAGIVTLTGGANFTANSVGGFITISNATTVANNGTFLITAYLSATSVAYANSLGVASDAGNPNIGWVERLAYSLNDDLDFARSDRSYIKGVNYDQPVPSYTRPTLAGVNVPTNLANIAGKTLDAHAKSVNRGQFNWPVEQTVTDIYAVSALKHSDAVDQTGVPCFDAAPWVGDWNTCFVEVTDAVTGNELEVLAGPQVGQRIFGITQAGAVSVSPTSVEIRWYSCPNGGNIATGSTAYTWEQGAATAKTGTTTVTATPGVNGASAITGLTAGGFASPADVGTWLTISGMTNPANNGTFVIISVQSGTAVTVQNHAAIAEGPTATVLWTQHVKTQPVYVNLTYGFNERLDQLDQNAFRFPLVSGLTGDADLRQDIIDIQSTGGWADGTTNLSTYLTNTGPFFAFNNLPGGAGDTVVAALNVLNSQIGNLTFAPLGPLVSNGQTITYYLQQLANAITNASVTRWIVRIPAGPGLPANTPITLPGAATYILDGTNNGLFLWVFWRGVLRDPGTVANGDDYAETSTTQITPYSKLNQKDHISFFIL